MSGKLKARQKSRWAASDVKAGILSMASSTSTTSQSSEHSAQCLISRASKWWEKNNMKWKQNHQKFHLNQHRTKRVLYAGFILGTEETKPWKKCSYTQETQTLLEDNSSWRGIASLFTNSIIINSPLYSQHRSAFSKPALIGFLLLTWLILEPPGRHTFPRDS